MSDESVRGSLIIERAVTVSAERGEGELGAFDLCLITDHSDLTGGREKGGGRSVKDGKRGREEVCIKRYLPRVCVAQKSGRGRGKGGVSCIT